MRKLVLLPLLFVISCGPGSRHQSFTKAQLDAKNQKPSPAAPACSLTQDAAEGLTTSSPYPSKKEFSDAVTALGDKIAKAGNCSFGGDSLNTALAKYLDLSKCPETGACVVTKIASVAAPGANPAPVTPPAPAKPGTPGNPVTP